MNNFLDRFKPNQGKKKKSGSNNNIMAGWFGNNQTTKSFGGQGQSLGGAQPGRVIPIELSSPGPLGILIEKRPNGTSAIVSGVVDGSQAQAAGLERGDVLCFAGSDGQEEILYNLFRELAKSNQRPVCFEVRRVPKTKAASSQTASSSSSKNSSKKSSAEAFARRQAVIAAAEQREKAHKKTQKPIPKVNTATLPALLTTAQLQEQQKQDQQRRLEEASTQHSAATLAALEASKRAETETARQLGYNPYEVKHVTAGQARTAVTATTHGTLQQPDDTNDSSDKAAYAAAIPAIKAPSELQSTTGDDGSEPSPAFQQAFETTVTSATDPDAVKRTLTIVCKLVTNATTKGQATAVAVGDEDAAAKFRKVRLDNPKIRAAVTDPPGAVDLLVSTGFVLTTDDATSESILVYPPGSTGPVWWPAALQQLQGYLQAP